MIKITEMRDLLIMSEFSQLLSKYIHEKNIKTYALARYCELERSNMYKIITGTRKPSSLEVVKKICKFLNLSYNEQQEMENAYNILILGPENYYRRKDVLNFFTNFRLPHLNFFSQESSDFHENFVYQDMTTTLNTSFEVNQALLHIITKELKNSTGHVRMLVQPNHDFLLNLLTTSDYGYSKIQVEHIICMNNSSSVSNRNYNLNCLEKLLPLYGNTYKYTCYYYYNNIEFQMDSFCLFPYMIITSTYACLLTSDFQKGYITTDEHMLAMLTDIFNQYLPILTPLLHPFADSISQIQYMSDINKNEKIGYSFQMTPCMTPYFSEDLIEKYLISDLHHRQEIVCSLNHYIEGTFRNTPP